MSSKVYISQPDPGVMDYSGTLQLVGVWPAGDEFQIHDSQSTTAIKPGESMRFRLVFAPRALRCFGYTLNGIHFDLTDSLAIEEISAEGELMNEVKIDLPRAVDFQGVGPMIAGKTYPSCGWF